VVFPVQGIVLPYYFFTLGVFKLKMKTAAVPFYIVVKSITVFSGRGNLLL